MSYRMLGDTDPCANASWWDRWFGDCGVPPSEAGMAHGRLTNPVGVTPGTLFGAGTTAGGHTFLCAGNPVFPLYRCAQWADGQGLTNAFGFPLTVSVMGDTRMLIPGDVSPSGVTATTSTRDESIINAIEGRPPAPGISPLWGLGALGIVAAGAFWLSKRKKRK